MLETESSTQQLINVAELRNYADNLKRRLTNGAKRPRTEVEESINGIYKSVGLGAPTIVWCQSPKQMSLMVRLLRILVVQQIRKPEADTMAAFRKATKQHHNEESYKQLIAAFDQQIDFKATRPNSFGQSIHTKLTNYLIRTLSPDLSNNFDSKFSSQSRIQIEKLLRETLHNQIQSIKDFFVITYYVRTAKPGSVETTLNQMQSHLNATEGLCPKSEEENKINFSDNWGAWEFYWIAAYEFAQAAAQLQFSAGAREAELANWLRLLDGASAYRLFEHFAFVCQHPNLIATDDIGRFHNSVGPALSFADGDKYYAWHGCLLPEWVIEKRNSICPALIDKQNNVELRRVMIDIYGFERYLQHSKLKKLHEDKYGVLYCKDLGGRPWQSIFVVEVVNATPEPNGKRRRYLLPVPPHMKTAKEAVAWTFGMTEDTYNPDFES